MVCQLMEAFYLVFTLITAFLMTVTFLCGFLLGHWAGGQELWKEAYRKGRESVDKKIDEAKVVKINESAKS
jgi:hypothetical protein